MKRALGYTALVALIAVYSAFWQMMHGGSGDVDVPQVARHDDQNESADELQNEQEELFSGIMTDSADDFLAINYPELLPIFSDEESWQRKNLSILFKSSSEPNEECYYFLAKGDPVFPDLHTVSLNACALVVVPKARVQKVHNESSEEISEPEPIESRMKRALVVETNERVTLSSPYDFRDLKKRKNLFDLSIMDKGLLEGKVVIRSGDFNDEETCDSAFSFETQYVTFTHGQVTTLKDVSFHFGRHYGEGVGLTIDYGLSDDFFANFSRKQKGRAGDDDANSDSFKNESKKLPETPEELENETPDSLAEIIERLADEGNLGNGFSIKSVVVNRLKRESGLTLYSFSSKEDASDVQDGGRDEFDHIEIFCDGSLRFEPTERNPGEWRLRMTDNVTANIFRKDEIQSAGHFRGSSIQLFFKDPVLSKLESFPDVVVRKAMRSFAPSGMLKRLEPTVIRVFDDSHKRDDDYSVSFVPSGGASNRRLFLRALQFFYDMKNGEIGLFNSLDPSAKSEVANSPPSELRILETRMDGGEVLSSITSPTVYMKMTENNEIAYLNTTGGGKLSTVLQIDGTPAVSNAQGPLTYASDETTEAASGKKQYVPVTVTWERELSVRPDVSVDATESYNALIAGGYGNYSIYQLTSFGGVVCDAGELGRFHAPAMKFQFGIKGAQGNSFLTDTSPTLENAAVAGPEQESESQFSIRPLILRFTNGVSETGEEEHVVLQTPRGTMEICGALETLFSDPGSIAPTGGDSDVNVKSSAADSNSFDLMNQSDRHYQLMAQNATIFCILSDAVLNGRVKRQSNESSLLNSRDDAYVSQINFTGGIDFVEYDSEGGVVAKVSGRNLIVENPQSSKMRLILESTQGKQAECRVNELNLQGNKIVVDMARNEFSVDGAGNIEILPKQKPVETNVVRLKPTTGNDKSDSVLDFADSTGPIRIVWSKGMVFDGKSMRFMANARDDVSVMMNDASLRCYEARLALKENVNLLDLEFNGSSGPEVDYMECLGSSTAKARLSFSSRTNEEEAPTTGVYSGVYTLSCATVRLFADSQEFEIINQGVLEATVFSIAGGVASVDPADITKITEGEITDKLRAEKEKKERQKAGTYQPSPIDEAEAERERIAQEEARKSPKWVRVIVHFNNAKGSIKDGKAVVNEHVSALVCDVASPDSVVDYYNASSWPENYITFDCGAAYLTTTKKDGQKNMVFVADSNVSFGAGFISGSCQRLSYDATKGVATIIGTDSAPAKFVRQEFIGAPRRTLAEFALGKLYLREKNFEVVDAQVSTSFNPAMILEQLEEK